MSQNLSLRSDNYLNLLPGRMYSKRGLKTDNSKVLLQNCFFLGSRVDITFWKVEEKKNVFPFSRSYYFLQFTDKIMWSQSS